MTGVRLGPGCEVRDFITAHGAEVSPSFVTKGAGRMLTYFPNDV